MEGAFSHYKILLVDDHELSLKLLQKQLEIIGFSDIDLAHNGQEALDHIKTKPYDIIFLDWAMPVMDGMAFLEEVRSDEKLNSTAIIMVSSEAQPEHIMEVLQAGGTSYLTKPVTQKELNSAVQKVTQWIDKRKYIVS